MKYFIARDRTPFDGRRLGALFLFNEKPERGVNVWNQFDDEGWHCESIQLDRTLFPELKWEDEPIEVELSIKPCKETEAEYDGLQFEYNDATMTVSVTGVENKEATFVKIPSVVLQNCKEYTVTTIGNFAFSDCHNLTSIKIPNSVTEIGKGAFYSCTSLKTARVSVSLKDKIPSNAFPSTCEIEWY